MYMLLMYEEKSLITPYEIRLNEYVGECFLCVISFQVTVHPMI